QKNGARPVGGAPFPEDGSVPAGRLSAGGGAGARRSSKLVSHCSGLSAPVGLDVDVVDGPGSVCRWNTSLTLGVTPAGLDDNPVHVPGADYVRHFRNLRVRCCAAATFYVRSAAGRSLGAPWLCVPASRRVCPERLWLLPPLRRALAGAYTHRWA